MLTPYPLTHTLNEIVKVVSTSLKASRMDETDVRDLVKYAKFVADELAVNAQLLECREAIGFRFPTMELTYEKTYSTVQEIRYIKHWPCLTGLPSVSYKQVTNEITARLKRSQMRLI